MSNIVLQHVQNRGRFPFPSHLLVAVRCDQCDKGADP